MFTKAGAEAYFNAEKSESLLFMVIGLLAIVVAIALLLIYKTSFYKGLAIPLISIGILQLVVGYTVYSRSDQQRMDIVYKMDMNPAAVKNQELPRMEKVMKSFKVYRNTEIVLLLAGIALSLFFQRKVPGAFWTGLGLALAVQAVMMLVADGFAEKRGREYLEGIKAFCDRLEKRTS